jgi:hypothetical protein
VTTYLRVRVSANRETGLDVDLDLALAALVALLALIAIVYVIFLLLTNASFQRTNYAYYNYLISAFQHGRADLVDTGTYDLSEYNGKWYMYWGPTPIIFILPFYALSNVHASDVIYGFVAGIFNVLLFTGCIIEFLQFFRLNVSFFSRVFVILNFALISPNFYSSLGGKIWYVNQVISILYLLAFIYFNFKFLNTHNLLYVLLAAFFFNLAWIARLSLVFHGLLILYVFGVLYLKYRPLLWRAIGITVAVSIIALVGFFYYNVVRFSNPFEFGYSYQTPAARFAADFADGRMFSLSHVPHNATYYFLNHVRLRLERPYVEIDEEGNSIFSVYPIVLFAYFFFKKSTYTQTNRWFIATIGSALIINFVIILMNLGTGWVQFGSRYFFDVVPGLFLLILFVVDRVNFPLKVSLLVYGTFINFVGALLYYHALQW